MVMPLLRIECKRNMNFVNPVKDEITSIHTLSIARLEHTAGHRRVTT